MAQRVSTSKNFRKSTNDLFETSNETRFKTIYGSAFKDHSKSRAGLGAVGG